MRYDTRAEAVADAVPPAPLCFDSRSAWVQYVAIASVGPSDGGTGNPFKGGKRDRWNAQFSPCQDCTAVYEADMRRQGRCQKGRFSWTPAAAQAPIHSEAS